MAEAKPYRNPSGDIVYRVQFRHDGKSMQRTFDDPEGAREFAEYGNKWGWDAALKLLEQRKGAKAASMTLQQWFDKYIDPESGILTGIQPGTRYTYRSIAKNSFLKRLGDHPIELITKDSVGAWVEWQQKQPSRYDPDTPVAAKTIRNCHALLSNLLKAANDRGMIAGNPAKQVRLTRGVQREGVFLSQDQFMKLLTAIPDRYKGLVVMLAATGGRWGEITALTWADINVDGAAPMVRINKAWKKGDGDGHHIGVTKTKAGRRTVVVEWPVIERLGPRGKPGDLVFRSPISEGRIRYPHFRENVWLPAVQKADLGVTPRIHDLRHTHASWQIARGVSLAHLKVRLGHEKITTTVDVYGHLLPDAHVQMAGTMDFLPAQHELTQ